MLICLNMQQWLFQCLLSFTLPDWPDSSHVCILWWLPSYCGETAGSRGPASTAEEGIASSERVGSDAINKITLYRLVWLYIKSPSFVMVLDCQQRMFPDCWWWDSTVISEISPLYFEWSYCKGCFSLLKVHSPIYAVVLYFFDQTLWLLLNFAAGFCVATIQGHHLFVRKAHLDVYINDGWIRYSRNAEVLQQV